ncbi:pyruvate, phosphate dikinase [Herbidospora galbida]|uniref:Pyruvate, phosphate dikinase n=1 Tax=Herbidospora galbida TaxID=2575442 RepID=A0A4U3MAD0_9ACTN|nr:PEP/pyruvate-binding domain-containing protein [Herbidospora galbida]TKK84516.1 pyruvate, phosphate dikinase [Herbidospora galbida]
MRWIHSLASGQPVEVLGGKAHGLAVLRRLGLAVPPAFVVGADACRAYLRDGRLPGGLAEEVAAAVAALPAGEVSVRSGASVSMPGMMTTVLGLPAHPVGPILDAVAEVFASWHTPRARTYRELHDIPHDLGTAVTIQAMVYGDRDPRSGTGVAFTRDPTTGAPVPFGDVLYGRRGDAVVSGREPTVPLGDLAVREPRVWAGLTRAMALVEGHYRDACYLEFTYESGDLWFLQVRPGRFTGAAAVVVAADLADEGVVARSDALLRVAPEDLRRVARITGPADVLARGLGACPGVATGRVATSAGAAVRMAAAGPVVLVRPETSPLDLRGMAAAAGIVTARGGPASHAAVVARAMGRPAVVGASGLVVSAGSVRAGDRVIPEGAVVTIDGTSGDVALGEPPVTASLADAHVHRLLGWADDVSGDTSDRPEPERLRAAHAVLRQ